MDNVAEFYKHQVENLIQESKIKREQMKFLDKEAEFILKIKQNFSNADRKTYENWLIMYLSNNGLITNYYEYSFYKHYNWRYVDKNLKMIPLYGARAFNIILSPGCNFEKGQDIGHCNIFYPDGTHEGISVPAYSDLEIK